MIDQTVKNSLGHFTQDKSLCQALCWKLKINMVFLMFFYILLSIAPEINISFFLN